MSYKDMIAEFEQSLDGYERALRDSSRKLSFLSDVDSSYLGHRYSARIRELNDKLTKVGAEKDQLERSFRDISRFGTGPSRCGSPEERGSPSQG